MFARIYTIYSETISLSSRKKQRCINIKILIIIFKDKKELILENIIRTAIQLKEPNIKLKVKQSLIN